jgi:hypothetical protein
MDPGVQFDLPSRAYAGGRPDWSSDAGACVAAHPFVGTAEFDERELEVSSELLSGKKLIRVDFVECYRRGDADGQDERPPR